MAPDSVGVHRSGRVPRLIEAPEPGILRRATSRLHQRPPEFLGNLVANIPLLCEEGNNHSTSLFPLNDFGLGISSCCIRLRETYSLSRDRKSRRSAPQNQR